MCKHLNAWLINTISNSGNDKSEVLIQEVSSYLYLFLYFIVLICKTIIAFFKGLIMSHIPMSRWKKFNEAAN